MPKIYIVPKDIKERLALEGWDIDENNIVSFSQVYIDIKVDGKIATIPLVVECDKLLPAIKADLTCRFKVPIKLLNDHIAVQIFLDPEVHLRVADWRMPEECYHKMFTIKDYKIVDIEKDLKSSLAVHIKKNDTFMYYIRKHYLKRETK